MKAIEISDLTIAYSGLRALDSVSLDVAEGEYLGIIGPNGGGKSTLLKAILGIVPTEKNKIKIFGTDANRQHGYIGYVPQFSSVDKTFPVTVEEVVLMGRLRAPLRPFFRYSSEDRCQARKAMEQVGLMPLAQRSIKGLSGGEFQKMLIARALTTHPRILLLDEPTASVDANAREQIYDLLDQLKGKITIVLVTHDMLAVSSQVQQLACLNSKLHYHGEPELNESMVNQLYGCPVDLIAHGVPHRVLKQHEEV